MRDSRSRRADDAGFSLAALITFMTVLSVLLAVAVPVYTTQVQRELEEELVFRGEEYVRAIQKYQRQFGVYPPDLDALLESNEMRFLRREYTDPITGEGFRLIKANPDGTLEGSRIYAFEDLPLFSGPLGSGVSVGGGSAVPGFGSVGAPAGPDAGDRSFPPTGDSAPGGGPPGFGLPGGISAGSGGTSLPGFGQPGGNPGRSDSAGSVGGAPQLGGLSGFGSPAGNAPGQSATGGLPGFTLPQGQGGGRDGAAGTGRGGASGSGGRGGRTGAAGRDFGGTLAGTLIGGGASGAQGNETGSGGGVPTAAISGIVGVAPNNEATSLIVYNDRNVYAEWEFIALPTTPGGAASTSGLMPGDEDNSGEPAPFGQRSSPFSSNPAPFGQ